MYKDKSKQREANRAAKVRFKAKRGIPATEGIPGIPVQGIPKRGDDIKCFADLPPDVQQDIIMMAASKAGNDQAIYERERRDRTERAIRYQHLFPNRYYPGNSQVQA